MIRLIFLSFVIVLTSCCSKNSYDVVSQRDSITTTIPITIKSESKKKIQLKNCYCEEFPELNDYISCDSTIFTNGARIYRRFNCDSSWLVFENKNIKRNIYSLEKELMDLTHRLGYVGWEEYKETILIADRLWSGSGSPYEYNLIDKESGKEIIKFGQAIYFNEEQTNPYFVALDTIQSKIRIYNLDTRKSALFPFNMSKIKSSEELGYFLTYPEELFGEGEIKKNIFKIEYSYRLIGNDEVLSEEIVIDLNKLDFK